MPEKQPTQIKTRRLFRDSSSEETAVRGMPGLWRVHQDFTAVGHENSDVEHPEVYRKSGWVNSWSPKAAIRSFEEAKVSNELQKQQ